MEAPTKKLLKILCMSDTHGQIHKINLNEQQGDIFIHGGDFTNYCKQQHIYDFVHYLDKLKFKHKIVICGNHEIHFDKNVDPKLKEKRKETCKKTSEELKSLLKQHCIYLEHQMVEIEGVRIFGSPYITKHGLTAFSYEKEVGERIWDNIPKVDILLTHGPPYGIADIGKENKHVGCPHLLQKVQEIKPKYHLFGHIHESGGKSLNKNGTSYINMSQCGSYRVLSFRPIKFLLEVDIDPKIQSNK